LQEAARERQEAKADREVAAALRRRAAAVVLAAEAEAALPEHRQLSVLLAVEAVLATRRDGEPIVPAAQQALRLALGDSAGRPLEKAPATTSITPDRRWLVAGGKDGLLRVWDLSANRPGEKPLFLRVPQEGVTALAISPDGHQVAAAIGDKALLQWDISASNS